MFVSRLKLKLKLEGRTYFQLDYFYNHYEFVNIAIIIKVMKMVSDDDCH
jgi:hypothetical protein